MLIIEKITFNFMIMLCDSRPFLKVEELRFDSVTLRLGISADSKLDLTTFEFLMDFKVLVSEKS